MIPLRQATLLGRLTDLLDLETLNAPPRMALWPGILPVLDLHELIQEVKFAKAVLDLTAASAWTVFMVGHTVPKKKRWKVWAISREVLSADGHGIYLAPAGVTMTTIADGINLGPASTSITYSKDLAYPIVMEADWALGIWNTANVGDGARNLNILYTEEDSYGL